MSELMVDFITSLDGYASGEGWPGFWGLEGPEYLSWLGEQPEVPLLMGATTYRLMSGMAGGEHPAGDLDFTETEQGSLDGLTQTPKVVFSSTLAEPLTWPNTTLVRGDAVEAVRAMKEEGTGLLQHDRQPQPLPVVGGGRPRRPVPGRHVPGHHRRHRLRAHLRRLPRRRPGDDRPRDLRRPHPAGRVQATRARAPTPRRPRVTSRDTRIVSKKH